MSLVLSYFGAFWQTSKFVFGNSPKCERTSESLKISNDDSSTALRVPVFNGEEKNFQSWWIKFQAYSRVKGFHGVLKDAGMTITEADIEILEARPSLTAGGTGARTAE